MEYRPELLPADRLDWPQQEYHMPESRFRRLAVLILGCGLSFGWFMPTTSIAAPIAPIAGTDTRADENATEASTDLYLRVVDDPGRSIALEIASRTFVSEDASKPTIALVAVAHVADQSFFDAIAKKLSEYDIVLYEAVAPAAVRTGGGETPEEKIDSTRRALTFVASMIEQYRAERSEYPADLATLRAYVDTLEPIVRNWFLHALTDPWGQCLAYQRTDEKPGYDLSSAGPPDADADRIRFDEHGSVHPMQREDNNLQKQLAEALGLAYQLESLPYGSPNWRISDMTAEDLYHAFSGMEVDFDTFSGTLAGTSFPARLAGMLLRFIRMLDAMYDGAISDMVKVLLIEILGDEEMIQASMKQLGADFAKILIDKRNQVVIDDVAAILENQPETASIAILYGAAHMSDLSERLMDQLGYADDGAVWLRAVEVDLTESRIDQRQLMQMRSMIQRMMRSSSMRRR